MEIRVNYMMAVRMCLMRLVNKTALNYFLNSKKKPPVWEAFFYYQVS